MPFNLHILGVIHSSPVKVVICVETCGLSQKKKYYEIHENFSDHDCSILPS